MTDSNDTEYYLSDATVREVRGAPTGRMSTFDGALDTAMWVFDTARLDALCSAVARVAEAKGRETTLRLAELAVERDALRAENYHLLDLQRVADADHEAFVESQNDAARDERAATNRLLAGLRAEVARLTRDGERLDWLENTGWQVIGRGRHALKGYGESLRAAIDAASATPDTEGE